MTTQVQETFLNRQLAHILRSYGVKADFEQRQGSKQLDVVTEVDGLRVVLEAEKGFHKKAQAIKDADARLRQQLASISFAVCYPRDATETNLRDVDVTWNLRIKAGEPPADWSVGRVEQLSQAVQQAPGSLSGTERAARMLSDSLNTAVLRLKRPVRQALAQAMDLPATKCGKGERGDRHFVAAKRGLLVVATAMLFHHKVQDHLPVLPPNSFDGAWPPASARLCTEQESVIDAYREAWRGILAVDYRPVFETGRAALSALSADPDTSQAIRHMAEVVGRVSELVAGLRHDLLGRVFHRVLDTARYDGSFYTSIAAAVLLASLAIREGDLDWSDPNAIASLKICDPACGTGTLLMAAAERVRDLRNAAGRIDPADEEALGLLMVEDVLWGYDVNLTATHMAASTLGMLSPKTSFTRMNIHRTLLGVFHGLPYLGSLDFLQGQPRLAAWPSVTQQVDSEQPAEPPPPMDLVIMNPPFTRDSLRHDQFDRADELAIKQQERRLFADQPTYMAGNSGAFLVLAEHLSKASTGKIAAILPLMSATDMSGRGVRRLLGNRYHIDTIVSSHDPSRIYFSENTRIGEILLVCRRWDGNGQKPPTRVINLAKNPATPLEALDTALRIERERSTEEPGQIYRDFTVQYVPAERIERGDWSAVNFLSPFLVEAYWTLGQGNTAVVPTVKLGSLAEIGPHGRRVQDTYIRSELPTRLGRRALWYHKTKSHAVHGSGGRRLHLP